MTPGELVEKSISSPLSLVQFAIKPQIGSNPSRDSAISVLRKKTFEECSTSRLDLGDLEQDNIQVELHTRKKLGANNRLAFFFLNPDANCNLTAPPCFRVCFWSEHGCKYRQFTIGDSIPRVKTIGNICTDSREPSAALVPMNE